MKDEFWINLPSHNVERARQFFSDIGFELDTTKPAPHMVSMLLGSKKIVVNIFDDNMFQEFIGGHTVTDAQKSNEVLFSIGAGSPQEVDEWAQKAENAGAHVFAKPQYKDGWMYGCGFTDPDGHRWNLMYMDLDKLPEL